MPRRVLFISSLALSLVASTQTPDDPVLRARTQRASALGIAEGDLPPVPRGIVEPPPLPPPEAHVKDSRKGSKTKSSKTKGKVRKGMAGAKRSKSAATKIPAKGKGR